MEASTLQFKTCGEDRYIYDFLRQKWVADTPEERVRQSFLHCLVSFGGYPKSLLSVEKKINALPHLGDTASFPPRRLDIVCFAKSQNSDYELRPLLLVECKACPLTKQTEEQVLGYNYYVQAKALIIVNQTDVLSCLNPMDKDCALFQEGMPLYQDLIK